MSIARNLTSLTALLVSTLSLTAQNAASLPDKPLPTISSQRLAPLDERISSPPQAFISMLPERTLTTHVLTTDEHKKFQDAVRKLSPLQQKVLSERLESFSFVDGMPNTALTYPVDPKDPRTRYYITIRGGTLQQTVSEFLTWKEQTIFDFSHSLLTLKVDAGNTDAILYVLLHEATHVVDLSLGLSDGRDRRLYSAEQVWRANRDAVPEYRNPLLDSILFRTDKTISITKAPALYDALSHTPFVSLYGSNNRGDDLAELIACYDLFEKLGQPFQIQLWHGNEMVFHYDPMRNQNVRNRFEQIKFFFAPDALRAPSD